MNENEDFTSFVPKRSLTSKLLILFGICILGTFTFTFFAIILGMITTKIPLMELMDGIKNPQGSKMWYFMMIMTGISHLGGFWLAGLAYLKWIENRTFESLNRVQLRPNLIPIIIILVIVFLPFNEFFMRMNENMELPKSLNGLQTWMKEAEENAAKLTQFLMDFTSYTQLIIAFIVIAIFAGIGEELIFRGILQNLLHSKLNNHHLAIWLSAIIFSTIHFQFFGFIPRMLLGAMFGYLYVWTGSLWAPIIAHTTNNGFVVIMMYLSKIGVIDADIEKFETPGYITILFTAFCAGILWLIHKNKLENTEDEPSL
ncbi:MAG: CPBP family intramembrane glutamic endopeptidase [Bacteroidota bacterium]